MICFALSHGTSAANVSDDHGDGQDSIAGALAGLSVGLFLIRWRSVRGFLDSGFTGRWRAYDENDQNRPTSDAHDFLLLGYLALTVAGAFAFTFVW